MFPGFPPKANLIITLGGIFSSPTIGKKKIFIPMIVISNTNHRNENTIFQTGCLTKEYDGHPFLTNSDSTPEVGYLMPNSAFTNGSTFSHCSGEKYRMLLALRSKI